MSGWIKLHRSITDHWLYTEKRQFSKFEAWNDILLTVNFTSGKSIIKGKVILINRGESILSLESWGKRWSWNKSAVKRFFDLLKKDEMIELKNETVTTRLIVCNYDSYQSKENADETQVKRRRNADETQTKPIEEEEERKEEKENNIIESIDFNILLDYFNNSFGKSSRVVNAKVKKSFNARLKEGYTKQDFKKCIDNLKNDLWHKENDYKYCTLEFISRSDKLDKWTNVTNEDKSNKSDIDILMSNIIV